MGTVQTEVNVCMS